MEVIKLKKDYIYWKKTMELAENCSWSAGPYLAKKMRNNEFIDFECPFAAIDKDEVVGFCTITKTDFKPDCEYTPWIGFVYVEENYRGKRISQGMIEKVLDYTKARGFNKVYITTEEENLYEKYGFRKIDKLKSCNDSLETILVYEF